MPHSSLIIRKLYIDEFTFWQSSLIEECKRSTAENVIICDPDLLQTQWLLSRMQQKGLKYSRLISSSTLEVIARLTADGCGIGILPQTVAKNQKKLKPIRAALVYLDQICVIYRPENKEVAAIREVINAIRTNVVKT